MKNDNLLKKSKKILLKGMSEHRIKKYYALVSGGKDSLTAANVADQLGLLEGVLFIDTTIGIKETKDFVVDLCKEKGWPLTIVKPVFSYEDLVMKYGFPGPSAHRYSFIYLKWKPLWRWLRERKDEGIGFISGTRRKESVRRLRTAKDITVDKSYKKMIFVAPLFDWSTQKVWEFVRKNNIEVSPVYKTLHLSGDCLCGAYAKHGEAELIGIFYPDMAKKIRELEKKCPVKKRCSWGNSSSMRGVKNQRSLESFLCADCQI